MELGVAYYPERCSEQQQHIDYQKMKEAGIRTIRIAEFAWSKLEPSQGEFQWEWLDRSIQIAGEYGLGVILCTPTACPPIWLTETYPDVLPVNESGQKMVFGKRQHRCYHSDNYNKYSKIIVIEMAKRYGRHAEVVGWQIDNELGGERQRCYCDNCKKAFQDELKKKYSSIEELNKRWGTAFWAEEYRRFEQINVPLEIDGQLKLKHNPSLELEFWRFSSKGIVDFCRMQENCIREYSDAVITTNTDSFAWGDCVDIYELFQTMDIAGLDLYSEDDCEISFYADIARSVKNNGQFWMMEYGVTSPKLSNELAGLSQMGCQLLSFFKMNPFPWGQEQGYNGLLTMTGQPTKNYQLLKECRENHRCEWRDTNVMQTEIGIFYSFDSSWSFSIATWEEKQERWIYAKYMLEKVYRSLYEAGKNADFIFNARQIEKHRIIFVPHCVIYHKELEQELLRFVEEGGTLIVSEDLFIKNQDNVYMTELPDCYSKFFGETKGLFLPETDMLSRVDFFEINFGRGRVFTVKHNADKNIWKQIVLQL